MSRFLDSVPVTAVGYFRESAEKLIEERGAVDALAAALAHISGATSLEQRSLLNSDAVSLALVWCYSCHKQPTHGTQIYSPKKTPKQKTQSSIHTKIQ